MRVFTHEQRARDSPIAPVFAYGLCYGENVGFRECRIQAGPAMAAGPEADELVRVGRIGLCVVERGFEPAHVNKEVFRCEFACKGMRAHREVPAGITAPFGTTMTPVICSHALNISSRAAFGCVSPAKTDGTWTSSSCQYSAAPGILRYIS